MLISRQVPRLLFGSYIQIHLVRLISMCADKHTTAHFQSLMTGNKYKIWEDLIKVTLCLYMHANWKPSLFFQFEDESSASCLSLTKTHLTLSCPNTGHWRKTLLENSPLQGPFTLQINPPEVLPAMQSLGDFTSLVSGTICPASPFDLLPPPATVGFLKLSRPCCYVFPAGRGDCAFFAINGFTVLVDGGSDSQACFWKLVRHLDRVDAVLLTHISTDNLPGVISFLERKVAEKELSSDMKGMIHFSHWKK